SCLPSTSSPMPSGFATVSCCWPMAACAEPVRSTSCAPALQRLRGDLRMCSLRSPDPTLAVSRAPRAAPLRPLLANELRSVVSGRALWTMLLLLCPLVGFSFVQAVSLYGEASAAARDAPVLASGLSPLDGVLVPTLGALYVVVTLLFPFVVIRTLG